MDIITSLRAALSERIGSDRFELWFSAENCLIVKDGQVVVRRSDQFSLDRIRSLFAAEIRLVASAILGNPASVSYQIDSQLVPVVAPKNLKLHSSGSTSATPPAQKNKKRSNIKGSNASTAEANNGSQPNFFTKRYNQIQTYVVGENSRLAMTAAQLTPGRLGEVSPLFIYGPTGCGKTHLLEGVYSATRRAQRHAKCVLLSAEQFTTSFLDALQGRGLPSFRRKYRDIDLLIIDDVQFFNGKKATIVEFQHTIDTLLRTGKQIVVSADRTPAELACLSEEVSARLSSGLVCGITYPDYETRLTLTQQICRQRKLELDPKVLQLIATECTGDARQIRGAVNRLDAVGQVWKQKITYDTARSTLDDLFQATRRVVGMQEIEKAVCSVFGIETEALRSSRKSKEISQPRMLAMWLSRKYTRSALSEIGDYYGGRSHSTVISAQKKVNHWVADRGTIRISNMDCAVSDAIRRVEANLQAG